MSKITKDEFAYLLIDSVEGIKLSDKIALISLFSAPRDFVSKFPEYSDDIKEVLNENSYNALYKLISDKEQLKAFYNSFLSSDTDIACYNTEKYPDKLYDLSEPPFIIYYRGNLNLLDGDLVLFDGTRSATSYGLDMTKRFVKNFVENDLTILSGLSDGVDTAAVEETIEHAGRSVIVAAGGIDKISPSINRDLAKSNETTGLVMSEFRNDVVPQRFHYLLRNRILAALCSAAILIEADEDSKSLGVIKLAADYGKEVFALPGNLTSKLSKAPNTLIANETARALVDPKQVVEIFRDNYYFSPKKFAELSAEENKIIDYLRSGEKHFDEILSELNLTYSDLTTKLFLMEGKKLIKRLPGNYFETIDEV